MKIDLRQIEATISRYKDKKRERQRARNKRLISEGRYLEIDDPDRVKKFLARREFSLIDTREFLQHPTKGLPTAQEPVAGRREPHALERILGTSDLIGIAFLERGLQVARSVGRIWIGVTSGRPMGYGTGFLISPRLLMTNHHVIEDKIIARKSLVEFDYQLGLDGSFSPTTTFVLDPEVFFFTDQNLDYAVVAVQPAGTGGRELADFGWNPLIEEQGKAIISQWLNIVQHPNGEPKQLCLRQNQLVDLLDDFLQYETDTAPGSSGSPVYNDLWEVVGLHHSGVWATNAAGQILAVDGQVWNEAMGEHRIKWIANEGARTSKIIAHLRNQPMNQQQKRLFEETFTSAPPLSERHNEKRDAMPPVPPISSSGVQVTVAGDGSATWTIPLLVSIRMGGLGAPSSQASTVPPPSLTSTVEQPLTSTLIGGTTGVSVINDLNSVLEAAKRELGTRADVLDVRPGYVFKNGWITDDRALVVTIRQKLNPLALKEAQISPLLDTFLGMPVEITNPSIEDLVRLARGPAVAEAAFSDLATLREEITYLPPDGIPLDQFTENMRVVAHVSPDAGWPQLSNFLNQTRKQLVIGMYDFGAPHIAEAVETIGLKDSFRKLTLVMQKGESVGEGTKADDLHDDEVVEKLSAALGNKFENAWVKTGRVNGWVSTSYHIKVAVRDQKAFWLSSGNWQSSNQPKADPLGENPPQRTWLDRYNREWHTIVEHSGLARVFEAYLLHDFRNNTGVDSHETLDLPDLLVPESFLLPRAAERTVPFKYFPPFEDTRPFTVTPLLTPDNYHEHVLNLIESASEELLIQNQTFNAPKEGQDKLRELIDAVLTKQREGVHVRVIFRLLFPSKARQVLEELKDHGFNDESIKVQKNCHTKGIIVDRKKVLLGSQNWSNDGVSVNRDASLLFDDEPLARYFAEIFDHDWNNLARKNIGSEWLPLEWTPADQATPPGMIRLTWKDYMEML